jgi:oligoribonuclease (3'-5' exoribonuclease)
MKYVSIDLETTGLDPQTCQILQIAMVIADTEDHTTPVEALPSFVGYLKSDEYRGNAYALQLNAEILKVLCGKVKTQDPIYEATWPLRDDMRDFLDAHIPCPQPVVLAGKNVGGFDLPFLLEHGLLNYGIGDRLDHRVLDPGPMYALPSDKVVPGLKVCLKRAGYDEEVTHDALDDARAVVKCIQAHMKGIKA